MSLALHSLSLLLSLSSLSPSPWPPAGRGACALSTLYFFFFHSSLSLPAAGLPFPCCCVEHVCSALCRGPLLQKHHTQHTHIVAHIEHAQTNPNPASPPPALSARPTVACCTPFCPWFCTLTYCVARQPMGLGLAAVGVLHMAVAASKPGRGCVHLRRVVAGAASRRGCAGDAAPLARKAAGAGWETSMFTGF